jgi:protein gp37
VALPAPFFTLFNPGKVNLNGHVQAPCSNLKDTYFAPHNKLSNSNTKGDDGMARTKIEWTRSANGAPGYSWNPLTGCTKISPGCKHCYAERMVIRLQAMGQPNYRDGFKLTLHEQVLEAPLRWKKPQVIFVNSMSDLFHKDVPLNYIKRTFGVMREAHWHQFQILTKRSQRLASSSPWIDWPANVWMGVSVETSDYVFRIEDLRKTGAKIKFLSLEPLLGPLPNLDLRGIDWVIVGGESGPGARPMNKSWVLDIRDQCRHAGVPFFFKQWGGRNKKASGRELDGRFYDEMPLVSFAARSQAVFRRASSTSPAAAERETRSALWA